VAEHETVHAYCLQAFGALGPAWFSEGMAEMAHYKGVAQSAAPCPAQLTPWFRNNPPKPLREVLDTGRRAAHLGKLLDAKLEKHRAQVASGRQVPLRHWTKQDDEAARSVREAYAWAWALCHLLRHNPNYAARFRALGQSYLNDRGDTFEKAFWPVRRQLDFEYRLFLKRFRPGYRVDLCHWDWRTKFSSPPIGGSVSATISAARGYQASGLLVIAGNQYAHQAKGSWTTSPKRSPTNADGGRSGRGRLVGVLMDQFELSKPIRLGASGAFIAPSGGRLYLRCLDEWGELADNQGAIAVRLTRRGRAK
jgi:hypothetical protein